MKFLGRQFGWSRKAFTVQAHHISVRGSIHKSNDIPNQDNVFSLHIPEGEEVEQHGKKAQNREKCGKGVYAAGVFDGHGPRGEEASGLAAERVKNSIHRLMTDGHKRTLRKTIEKAFREVSAALDLAPCGLGSGTTATVVIARDDDVIVGNVGDSDALYVSGNHFIRRRLSQNVSRTHRPSDKAEAERITKAGGFLHEGYVVDEKARRGIAITRSLGDRDMRSYGCIPVPDIYEFKLEQRNCAVVIASDGLWDVPNFKAKQAVLNATSIRKRTPKKVCQKLLNFARAKESPTDDCTILCMTFSRAKGV